MNRTSVLERSIEQLGERECLLFQDRGWTNKEILERGARLSSALSQLQLQPDARVASLLPNRPEFLISAVGAWRAGYIYVPLLSGLDAHEAEQRLHLAKAEVLITCASRAATAEGLLRTIDSLKWVILSDEVPPGLSSSFLSLDTLLQQHEPMREAVPRTASDPAVFLYSSGTTGTPKQISERHFEGVPDFSAHPDLPAPEILPIYPPAFRPELLALELAHSFGFRRLMAHTFFGGKLILLEKFEPESVLRAIDEHRCEAMGCTPPMLSMLMSVPNLERFDTSSMKMWRAAAAPCSAALIRQFESRFSGRVLQGYAMTECIIAAQRPGDEVRKVGSVGKVLPSVNVTIQDDAGKSLGPSSTGEVCVSGLGLNAEHSAADGWFHTGDLGHLDEDGHLFIVGRKKQLIIVGGFNVIPVEVSEVIEEHAAVKTCCVFGMPDDLMGEEVVAYVVLNPGAEVSERALYQYAAEKLTKYKLPHIEFVDSLPTSRTGKIDVKRLTELEESRRRLSTSGPNSDLLDNMSSEERADFLLGALLRHLEEQTGHEMDPTSSIFDQGVDSIDATRLITWVRSSFNVAMPLWAVFQAPAPLELTSSIVEAISGSAPKGPAAVDIEREAVLDSDIEPPPESLDAPSPGRRFLLTGATGFLGAFILHKLLKTTTAEIFCLVRAGDSAEALERIESNLSFYGLWEKPHAQRIQVVSGDLSKPRLGLSKSQFSELALHVDRIIHNGAWVNHLRTYEDLKATNVLGTHEVLRLACAKRRKPITFVSTSEPGASSTSLMGYTLSKWVAERLVKRAADRGLPASVCNVGFIIGAASESGAANTNDRFSRLIKACFQLGAIPDAYSFAWVPVDYVAGAIVNISLKNHDANTSYRFQNMPKIETEQMAEWMREYGVPCRVLTPDDWSKRLAARAHETQDSNLISVLGLSDSTASGPEEVKGVDETKPDDSWRVRSVTEAFDGPSRSYPVPSQTTFTRFLSFLDRQGYLRS